jgi:serine/threonine protein kinase
LPLPTLSTSSPAPKSAGDLNAAIGTYNNSKNRVNLGRVEVLLASVPRDQWQAQIKEVEALEKAIEQERSQLKLPKLSIKFSWSSSFAKPSVNVNTLVDAYNNKKNFQNLGTLELYIEGVPRAHWQSQFKEFNELEEAIRFEKANYGKTPVNIPGFGPKAAVNKTPSVWVQKLFPDAPELSGLAAVKQDKSGQQGATFHFESGGKNLLAKVDKSKDKGFIETECKREFRLYEKLLKFTADTGDVWRHLPKVWGWADMKIGDQHEFGMVMDRIEGFDGYKMQKTLKDSWDLGVISSAEYWSAIQYIGRCHVAVLEFLKRAGLVHNDFKAENYMVDGKTGEVIVIDLGGASGIGENPKAVTKAYAPSDMNNPLLQTATMGGNVFVLGATLVQATESPHIHHDFVKPNQGINVVANASHEVPEKALGDDQKWKFLVRRPYQYGVETAFTRQLQEMMSADPLKREANVVQMSMDQYDLLTERQAGKAIILNKYTPPPRSRSAQQLRENFLAGKVATPNTKGALKTTVSGNYSKVAFLNDSILSDEETRKVLKGVIDGTTKRTWNEKWLAAVRTDPSKRMPLLPVNRLQVEHDLRMKMRDYQGGGAKSYSATLSTEPAAWEESLKAAAEGKQKMIELGVLCKTAKALGVDTTLFQGIVNNRARHYAWVEQEIARLKKNPPKPKPKSKKTSA